MAFACIIHAVAWEPVINEKRALQELLVAMHLWSLPHHGLSSYCRILLFISSNNQLCHLHNLRFIRSKVHKTKEHEPPYQTFSVGKLDQCFRNSDCYQSNVWNESILTTNFREHGRGLWSFLQDIRKGVNENHPRRKYYKLKKTFFKMLYLQEGKNEENCHRER